MPNSQWVDTPTSEFVEDNLLQWFSEEIEVQFNYIWADSDYVYTASSLGTKIYDIASEDEYAYINYAGGFNTVWGNDDRVFYGTTNSGIKYINKTCISGSIVTPIDLYSCLLNFSNLTVYPALTSNDIRYIHGYEDRLCIVTNSGIDVIKLDPQGYKSSAIVSGVNKCFMTSPGKFYYTISGTSEWSLNRVDSCLCDWDTPDYCYTTGSGIFESDITINDIFITEGTADDGVSNTVFCATSSGIYVICEFTDSYNIYYVEE